MKPTGVFFLVSGMQSGLQHGILPLLQPSPASPEKPLPHLQFRLHLTLQVDPSPVTVANLG